jgi:putative methionine-R-sulfoxide reductase with GAF domain
METRAELVVLISDPVSGRIHGQIDLDSDRPGAFTPEDERELRRVADWLGRLF